MLRPLGNRVLVEPEQADKESPGGIVLPDTVSDGKVGRGRVLAVGAGRLLEDGSRVPPDCNEGDTVVYSRYSGTEIELLGETLLALDGEEIIAVVLR